MLKSHYPSVTKLLIEMDSIINLHINTNQPKGSEHVYLKILGEKKILKKRAWKVPWKEGSVFSISFQHCTLSHLNSAEVKGVCVCERERERSDSEEEKRSDARGNDFNWLRYGGGFWAPLLRPPSRRTPLFSSVFFHFFPRCSPLPRSRFRFLFLLLIIGSNRLQRPQAAFRHR